MIIDTGILYAAVDADDRHHVAATEILGVDEPPIVPEPVVVETEWAVQQNLGVDAEVAFLRGLEEGSVIVEAVTAADRLRAADVIEQYRDADLGYVDAVIVAVAERLGERTIATIDRRDFNLVKPLHIDAFEIVP